MPSLYCDVWSDDRGIQMNKNYLNFLNFLLIGDWGFWKLALCANKLHGEKVSFFDGGLQLVGVGFSLTMQTHGVIKDQHHFIQGKGR